MATSSIKPGAAGSPFTLPALGSGRAVSQVGDAPLLLVFHDQNTVDKVQAMQQAVRMRYSDARQLRIASVVNMKSVPVFLRSTAESVMKGSYNKAADAMPPGLDAADYVIILLDWDGSVSKAYGAQKIERRPRLVLLDTAGTVRGIHQGEEIEQAALAMVAELLDPPAPPKIQRHKTDLNPRTAVFMDTILVRLYSKERWVIIAMALVGLALRLWALGDKGLAYDEAATALMARASGPAIIQFHWNAAFEHPPLWQLTMRAWSALFGQSEAMLRLLPALAGAAAVPLTWYWLRQLWSRAVGLRLLAAGLVAFSPVLVIYAQEARMYTVVVLLALLSLLALVELARRPSWTSAALFVVVNWLMLGYHYYSLLLVGSEWIFFLVLTVRSAPLIGTARREEWRGARWWDGACLVSIVPILLWMLFSPGFHDTLTAVTRSMAGGPSPALFFDGIWRDLSFGALRWQPDIAAVGYVLLPLVAIGVYAAARTPLALLDAFPDTRACAGGGLHVYPAVRHVEDPGFPPACPCPSCTQGERPRGAEDGCRLGLARRHRWPAPTSSQHRAVPDTGGALHPLIVPALYTLAAAGIVWLGRRHWVFGLVGIVLAAIPAVAGLGYYYGFYHKSEYRDMAAYLREHIGPGDAIMLYAPRQHLLAKYYLGEDRTYYTAPEVDLPDYWPVNAPPVVPEEMDGQIQDLLAKHTAVWLVMTAQDEVDDGEFVPKYFTAVAYKQDCRKWIDVELCRFVSPTSSSLNGQSSLTVNAAEPVAPDLLYNGELRLQRAQARLVDEPQLGQTTIYAQLDWLAERKPSVDYRVTLRLLDSSGRVTAQRDEYPIGQLLPPTTWKQGDAKPGYMALPISPGLPAGTYQVTVDVYDPATEAPYATPVTVAQFTLPATSGE